MKEKDELLQIFPTPVFITKYEENIDEETKYIENLEYTKHKDTKGFCNLHLGCISLSKEYTTIF